MGTRQNYDLVSHIYYEKWVVYWKLDLAKVCLGARWIVLALLED